MKKIIDKFEILDLYIKEFPYKIKQLAESRHWELKIMMNPNSFHFMKFKMKHFFLNMWKQFLNWCEVKFFPEFTEPRFEKKPLWWIVKPEFQIREFKYRQRVQFLKWFFEWYKGVILGRNEFFWGLYEVEILFKWKEKRVSAWSSDMQIIEDKKKPRKS